ncbi:MAG: hypothetical protein R2741_09415 [Methanolobus sp.]
MDSSGNAGSWYNLSVGTKRLPTITINDLITDIRNSSTYSTITLSCGTRKMQKYVEIWRNQEFIGNSSDAEITDTGLDSGTVYNYSLKPVGTSGTENTWYNVSVTTKTTPIITDLVNSSNSSTITLSWDQEYTEHVEIWINQSLLQIVLNQVSQMKTCLLILHIIIPSYQLILLVTLETG